MKKRIMAVDDSPTVRQVLQLSLKSAGCCVIEAKAGVDAIRKLETEQVDMLVTDLDMPGMDGISLFQQARRQPGNRFMPIIMLTSEDLPEKKPAGKAAGASGWINKPCRPDQLLAVVRVICPA